MQSKLSIGFLGAGKMATALARGFIQARVLPPRQIVASDVAPAAGAAFQKAVPGARLASSNRDVAKQARVLVLAVKPDQVETVLNEVKPLFTSNHLLISIAAGVPLSRLQAALGEAARVVRVMPNTPALVGAAACGYAPGKRATPEDASLVQRLLAAVGVAFPVKESLLDAVTGLSGSGPAYACLVIEALSDGGVAAGLPREVATRLAAQTLLGSARMVLETGLHPGALKDMVASPGGTTIEGLHELEKAGLRAALINAVRAAAEKSRKLGQG
jgi:pyrroline-5-carboxylate reductase